MPYVETPPSLVSANDRRIEDTLDGDFMEPIAVIGFALKGPGDAITADAFWDMLVEGRCGASEFPNDRINIESFSQKGIHRSGDVST
jgi:acyl transferase domain-containing protein